MKIDFGDISGNGGDEINFEIIDESSSIDTGDIDWGEIEVVPAADSISFDLSLEESGIVVADSGMDGGVARGAEAYTLLDSTSHRDQLFDELYEVILLKIISFEIIIFFIFS